MATRSITVTSNFRYTPLFLTKNAKAWDVDGNVKDVNDGSELSFPPNMYKTLYKNLGLGTVSSQESAKDNTGQDVIGNTYPYDLSTSTLTCEFCKCSSISLQL